MTAVSNQSSFIANAELSRGATSSYSDIHGLQSIKQLGQVDKQAALAEVSKQFESILVNMMLKNMRSATNVLSEGSFLGGDKVNFYQEMLDDELSINLTKDQGFGFADAMMRQLGGDDQQSESQQLQQQATLNTLENTEAPQAIPIDQALFASRIAIRNEVKSQIDQLPYAKSLSEIKPSVSALTTENTSGINGSSIDTANNANQRFDSPQAFVQALYPSAEQAAKQLGVTPEILLAQAALETGWGQHMPSDSQGKHGFNLFGIKADERWNGASTKVETLEYFGDKPLKVNAAFRSYDSFDQSFNDYVNFVSSQPRYQDALQNTGDSSEYIQALHQAGYATDPRYAEKIQQILNRNEFKQTHTQAALADVANQAPQG